MAKTTRIFDPDLLEVLLSLAETRSFTESARLLESSQPVVSTAIRRLEEAAGCELVNRSTHSVSLTRHGEEMLRYARIVQGLAREAERRFSQPDCTDILRLGVFNNFDSPLLADALARFNDRFRSVQVVIETNRSDILLSRFRDGLLDVILAARQPGHGLVPPLWRDDLVWIGNRTVPTDPLDPVPLAVRVAPSTLRRIGIDALNGARRRHLIAFESNSYNGVVAALKGGLGFSVFPRRLRPSHVPIVEAGLPDLGGLDFVLLKPSAENRDFVLFMHETLEELSPDLFESAAMAMFGSRSAPVSA